MTTTQTATNIATLDGRNFYDGTQMTGTELRARRMRLPSHRNKSEPRSQAELATDLGYGKNTIPQLERGAHPLGKRGQVLDLALRTLERDAGLTEWAELPLRERERLIRLAKQDLTEAASVHGPEVQKQSPRIPRKGKQGK